MAAPEIELEELQALGQVRPDDLIDWNNEHDLQKRMAWIKACRTAVSLQDDGATPSNVLADWVVGFADQSLIPVEAASGIGAVPEAGNIFSSMKNYLAHNFTKGVVNITEGRKTRKYGIMFAGMAGGAVAGALIGTLIFPGIGTAVGGTIGGVLAGASPVILGVISGVIGSFVGTYFSKRIAKKLAKGEDTYVLYQKPSKVLRSISGMDVLELTRLHAYIKNREDNIPKGSPLHKALQELRKKAFKQGSKSAFEQLVYFMVQERQELLANPSEDRAQDTKLMQSTLEKLEQSPKLSKQVVSHVKHALHPELADRSQRDLSSDLSKSAEVRASQQLDPDPLKHAAEMLLKDEIAKAKDLGQLAEALERYKQHGKPLEDVNNDSIDADSIIRRIQKCRSQIDAGQNDPKLGNIRYVHKKYGIREKVESLLQEGDVSHKAKVSALPKARK